MTRVMRVDLIDLGSDALPEQLRTQLAPPITRPDGFMIVEGFAARTGIQVYSDGKGGTIREYRPPEEVFSEASMASWEGSPFGDRHDGIVTPKTSKNWTGGAVLAVERIKAVEADGDEWVKVRLVIHDDATIKAVEGGARQLSAGYATAIDATPGVTPRGDAYDAIQRNIEVNHLARVDSARAGSHAQLRMDGAGNVTIATSPTKPPKPPTLEPEMTTTKIRLDGKTIEVVHADAATIEAADATIAKLRKDQASAAVDIADQTKRADDADEKVKTLTKELDTEKGKIAGLEGKVKTDEQIKALVESGINERVVVVAEVAPFVEEDTRPTLATMDAMAIKRAFVANERPKLSIADATDDFINGLYGEVLRQRVDGQKGTDGLRAASAAATPKEDGTKQKAYGEYLKKNYSNC